MGQKDIYDRGGFLSGELGVSAYQEYIKKIEANLELLKKKLNASIAQNDEYSQRLNRALTQGDSTQAIELEKKIKEFEEAINDLKSGETEGQEMIEKLLKLEAKSFNTLNSLNDATRH